MRILSVESQVSFLFYVRGGCRHNAPLSCARNATTDTNWSYWIENLWSLRTVALVHIDNIWIMRNLQSEFGHTSRMFWIELDCTCTKRSDTYSTCEWGRLRLACTFDTSLASHNNVFCDLFCLPNTLTCEVWPNKALVSLRIIAVNWYIYIVIFGIAWKMDVWNGSNQNSLHIPYLSLCLSPVISVGLALACWPSGPGFKSHWRPQFVQL